MKVKNLIEDLAYVQWIEDFVQRVIEMAKIKYDNIEIYDIEPNKRIFLRIDGQDYTIRTWNYRAVGYDDERKVNSEEVEYTLYVDVKENGGSSHGEIVGRGMMQIKWDNK